MNFKIAAVLAVALMALSGIANVSAGNSNDGRTIGSPDEGGPTGFTKCTVYDGFSVCVQCHTTPQGDVFCAPRLIVTAPYPGPAVP